MVLVNHNSTTRPILANFQKNNHQGLSTTMMLPVYTSQKHQKKSSKCFVYCFTTFALLCVILFVFSLVVILVKKPTLTINSMEIKSLYYDNSPTLSLTTLLKISLQNPNFGHMEISQRNNSINSLSMVYGNASVLGTSELKFPSGRVASRGEEEVEVEMKMVYNTTYDANIGFKEGDVMSLSNDLSSGKLELIGYAVLKGEVYLIKNKIKRSAVAVMNCTIDIDLIKQSVQRLIC